MKILLFLPKNRKNLQLRGKFDRPRAEKLQGAQFFRNYVIEHVNFLLADDKAYGELHAWRKRDVKQAKYREVGG